MIFGAFQKGGSQKDKNYFWICSCLMLAQFYAHICFTKTLTEHCPKYKAQIVVQIFDMVSVFR